MAPVIEVINHALALTLDGDVVGPVRLDRSLAMVKAAILLILLSRSGVVP